MTSNNSVLLNSSELLHQLNYNMTVDLLPVTIMIGLDAVIGFVGNVLILIIYSKRYERSNFRYFVLSMAIIDLTSCLTTMPGEMFLQMNWYMNEHEWICKGKSYFNVMTAWGSASILLLLAFDRHRKVCHTLEWQIHPSLALRLCITSIAISAFISIPITILWGKQSYVYVHDGVEINVSICEKSSQYADDIYPFVYILFIYILPVGLMMFIVVSVNILTGKQLFSESLGITNVQTGLSKSVSKPTMTRVSLYADINVKERNSDISFINNHSIIESNHTSRDIDTDNRKKTIYQTEARSDITNDTQPTKAMKNSVDVKGTTVSSSVTLKCLVVSSDSDEPGTVRTVPNNTDTEIGMDVNKGNVTLRFKKDSDTKCSDIVRVKSPTNVPKRKYIRQSGSSEFRRKRKTVIMLILTSVFVATMTVYVITVSMVAGTEGILRHLSNYKIALFFFFWRLYFVNCVVNPILYGFMDPRFRSGLKKILKRS